MVRLPLAPTPPIAMQTAAAPDHVTMTIITVFMLAALVFAVVHWLRSGRPIAFACMGVIARFVAIPVRGHAVAQTTNHRLRTA